jgi:AcrR family transcriptional regulator
MTTQPRQMAARPYRKGKRAASDLETRERITEAAVALHQTVGPARTTVKAIADRARVDRATVYRHFSDEQVLFNACTSHYYARHPMPDSGHWIAIADRDERLRTALAELYTSYGETEEMLANAEAPPSAHAHQHTHARSKRTTPLCFSRHVHAVVPDEAPELDCPASSTRNSHRSSASDLNPGAPHGAPGSGVAAQLTFTSSTKKFVMSELLV